MTAGPFVLLALALLAGAYYLLQPAPPKRVVLATGSEQGAYAEFGKRYQEELKRYGIEVVLKPTAGSRENLRLLQNPKNDVQLAFVQGGSAPVQGGASAADAGASEEEEDGKLPLMSLGSMFYEPLWLFYRAEAAKKLNREGLIREFSQLRGLRVNVGARGSGIPGVVSRLMAANLMDRDDIVRSNLDLTPAVMALLAGQLDAVAMVSAPESQLVQSCWQDARHPHVRIRAGRSYARRYRFLSA